jgi:hypothetical protein
MRDPVEKTIDGEQYTFCQLPPKKSLKLLTRLVRIVGPSVGAAMGGHADISVVLGQEINFEKIVSAICGRLDENEVESIVDDLLSQVIHNGQGEVSKKFDVIFGGRLPHLFKVVGEALRVEYGDFLAGMPDLKSVIQRAGTIQGQRT